MFVPPVGLSFSACFLFPHAAAVGLSIVQYVHWCFWRLFCRPPPRPPHRSPPTRFPPQDYRAAPVDASPISLVRVVRSPYSWIASIHCFAVRAGIRSLRIWIVITYELDRVVKMCLHGVIGDIFGSANGLLAEGD